MDPTEILTVRFHYGGEFIRMGPNLDYVGGDEEMSHIERDKLSLQEVKGFLKDHVQFKDSMKLYFLIPGKDLANGLMFLHNDNGCVQMGDYICPGGVADIFVEYHGEEDTDDSSSGSDFEDEIHQLSDDDQPDIVISVEPAESSGDVFVPDETGVITEVISSPAKCKRARNIAGDQNVDQQVGTDGNSQVPFSQVCNPTQGDLVADQEVVTVGTDGNYQVPVDEDSGDSEDSESDHEYIPHSEDSGENSEVCELRRHARKFKKRMRDTKSWIGMDANSAIPVDLIANMEEQLEGEEKDWAYDSSDEDYSYDEDSDGHMVRRKTNYPRYNNDTEVPHFVLSMVFRSKNQLVKALKRYGLVTKRSIKFVKSESDRVRAKCGWPNCPWLLYAAKTTRSSRFQIITFNDDHQCAQNRDNRLVTAKVIAQRYEHFILANPMWKIESMKATVLQDMFADVSTSKCKHAKQIVMEKLLSGMKNEYNRVFDYQLELLRSNPGSIVAVKLDPSNMHQNIFQSFYVCFNALKLGFKAGCRKVIGLDGCFFKGVVKGELLCAIARDANNQMYPLAWAVVEMETNETWKWFIAMLIKDLDINNNGDGWVFISDQQKGLINAMKDYLPKAEHRMCARHIYANWRKKHRAHEWQKKFWAVAKASNKQDFNYYKAKLAQETPEGVKDMMRTDPEHWVRAFFPVGSKCESVDNNLCESFNHAIVDARFYPIISMQEKIRYFSIYE
jgi:hypothetical protein